MRTDISNVLIDAAYQTYERRLLHQVKAGAVPNHVAVIMDGNRRFAKEIGLGNSLEGHEKGRDKLEEGLEGGLEIGGEDQSLRRVPLHPRRGLRRAGGDPPGDPGRRPGRAGWTLGARGHQREVLLPPALHGRPAGPGPRPADERGGADLELPPLAARLRRALLRRGVRARIPEDRLPPRDPVVPDAPAALRPVRDRSP